MELLKIVGISLAAIMGFVGYATYGIPLVVPAPPPEEAKISGEITMDQFIALGDKIFNGKGTCTLCHNPVGGRAPILDQVGPHAKERLEDPRYEGKAANVEEYIYESMTDPSAYVVAGFGKPGTNDTVSPMPDVSGGAIGLSEAEMKAVIAYLQSSSGVDVTVQIPTGEGAAPAEEEEEAAPVMAASAEEAFNKFGCVTCHKVPGVEEAGDLGPDLTTMAESAGDRVEGMSAREFVMDSIVNPNAAIAEGFDADMMPPDFADQMMVAELNMIVDALLGESGGEETE
ncbi:MAG: c-type cytochrome [Candidatus Nitrospinota bacterium M3_3B_026]